MKKRLPKTIPFGAAHTYIAHIREYHSPPYTLRDSEPSKRAQQLTEAAKKKKKQKKKQTIKN